MTSSNLLITVRLASDRYHGLPEWPPSPFRLYQALMAGALTGAPKERAAELEGTFRWLESLDPPTIAAPPVRRGSAATLWVPNNDIDTVGGDPRRVPELRTAKTVEARLLPSGSALAYLWRFREEDSAQAANVADVAGCLYQLGRGVDMASATAEILTDQEAQERLAAHGGAVHHPASSSSKGEGLRCPAPGSYSSLITRHEAQRARMLDGHLTQAPPPRFRVARYDAESAWLLFDLMSGETATAHRPVALKDAAWLVEAVRDRLSSVMARSFDRELVERTVIGRNTTDVDKPARLWIIPLPSIGSSHADRAIRRVLLAVPPNCPIPTQEIEWAAGAVHLGADDHGEVVDENLPQLIRAEDERMLRHFGVGRVDAIPARVWRTVTPVVLPTVRPKGRASGRERMTRESEAAHAVRQALRHAGHDPRGVSVRVQPEPFDRKGTHAHRFVAPNRLSDRSLQHVEIIFPRAVRGPLVVGDGRYMGIGVMAPATQAWRQAFVFRLPQQARVAASDASVLLAAVRRALLSSAESNHDLAWRWFGDPIGGGGSLGSGDNAPASLVAEDTDGDGFVDRVVVAAPWAGAGLYPASRHEAARFDRVVSELPSLHLAQLGFVALEAGEEPNPQDDLLGTHTTWESRTRYRPRRRVGTESDAAELTTDLIEECARRDLPRPVVEVSSATSVDDGHVELHARLSFSVAIEGPLLLGRDTHLGKGVFGSGR